MRLRRIRLARSLRLLVWLCGAACTAPPHSPCGNPGFSVALRVRAAPPHSPCEKPLASRRGLCGVPPALPRLSQFSATPLRRNRHRGAPTHADGGLVPASARCPAPGGARPGRSCGSRSPTSGGAPRPLLVIRPGPRGLGPEGPVLSAAVRRIQFVAAGSAGASVAWLDRGDGRPAFTRNLASYSARPGLMPAAG